MNFFKKINSIFISHGLKILIVRIVRKLLRSIQDFYSHSLDKLGLYDIRIIDNVDLSIKTIFQSDDFLEVDERLPHEVLKNFLSHRFDLLGSGWVRVYYGMRCRGLEGNIYSPLAKFHVDADGNWLRGRLKKIHLKESQEIWYSIGKNYLPIDWQIDFKSGARWSEKTWYKDIMHGQLEGVDIKVPWELSRMQHLPLLAKEYLHLDKDSKEAKKIIFEFRNQILDFIATNPVRYGVNWACNMDVSIRASNWLLAFDILSSANVVFDDLFLEYFTKSVSKHGEHIKNNLEWNYGERGNHYLSNICGLAFISRYLKSTENPLLWLPFCIKELICEINFQFHSEGTHFEASTGYHKLSSEMLLFTTSLILGVNFNDLETITIDEKSFKVENLSKKKITLIQLKDINNNKFLSPFPKEYLELLEKAGCFMSNIEKYNGEYPQIGDDDSGKFFNLSPIYEELEIAEAKAKYINLKDYSKDYNKGKYYLLKNLDCNHIGKISEEIFDFSSVKSFDRLIVRKLIGDSRLPSFLSNKTDNVSTDFMKISTSSENRKAIISKIKHYPKTSFKSKNSLKNNLSLYSYPSFGLYIYKSNNLYLSIRCCDVNSKTKLGHMHYDQLSVELTIGQEELITDPGSYNYTALPSSRISYRSSEAHFSPFSEKKLNSEENNSFGDIEVLPAKVKIFSENEFLASFRKHQKKEYYWIEIEDNEISFSTTMLEEGGLDQNLDIKHCKGYGININRQV